jgi:tetratricopeptide (TPR) repeat protein
MRSTRQSETAGAVLDLIDCGQFQRAEKLLKTERLDGSLGFIHEAEIHIYFDRLQEAGELLDQVRPEEIPTKVAARYALARGEWFYWRFEFEPAQQHFHMAEYAYRLVEDEYGLAKALYNLGRLKRREADFEAAQDLLNKALELLKDHKGKKKDYLKALIDFNLGVCAHQSGLLDKAADLYTSAMVVLNKLEHGKNYGITLSSYATLLRRKGKYEESLSIFNEAIRVLQGCATFEPLGVAMNNLAQALIRLERNDEAEKLLEESNELFQRAGNIASISSVLATFADLYLAKGALTKAETFVSQAIEQADLSHNQFVKAEALITLGRIEIKRSDFYAAAKPLREALDIGHKLNSRTLETAAMLYLAECELPTAPIKAQEHLTQVRERLEEDHDAQMKQELERIRQRAKGERLKLTPDNTLIVNGNFLPDWYAAKEAMETFMLKNALQQTGGNLTKAGKILGISKVHVHDRKKKYKL